MRDNNRGLIQTNKNWTQIDQWDPEYSPGRFVLSDGTVPIFVAVAESFVMVVVRRRVRGVADWDVRNRYYTLSGSSVFAPSHPRLSRHGETLPRIRSLISGPVVSDSRDLISRHETVSAVLVFSAIVAAVAAVVPAVFSWTAAAESAASMP